MIGRFKYISLLLICFFIKCSNPAGISNTTSIKNSPKQIQEAKEFIEKFHPIYLRGNIDSIISFVDIKNVTKMDFENNKHMVDTLFGKLLTYNLDTAYSINITEGFKVIKYLSRLTYKCEFEKKNVTEDLEVEKIDNSLKITYYNLNTKK